MIPWLRGAWGVFLIVATFVAIGSACAAIEFAVREVMR